VSHPDGAVDTGRPVPWLFPPPGARVRQTVENGPFVISLREDMGMGGCRLTRHRGATSTTFVVVRYAERSEVGLPCHVVHLEDERDGAPYVLDSALMGPGFPPDAFALVDPEG
jgi:hypothetical protein